MTILYTFVTDYPGYPCLAAVTTEQPTKDQFDNSRFEME